MSGVEVQFTVTFTSPLVLPAGHYYFVTQVQMSSGSFLWLSAAKPIVAPGTPFVPDLQTWTRTNTIDSNWLRVGTDIVGGEIAPQFNGTFSLSGEACVALEATPNPLPDGTAGSTYSQQLVGSGGVDPYSFSVTGTLPNGITLTPAGFSRERRVLAARSHSPSR